MLSNRSFLEHEIPYRQLDKLGISKKNILALNKDILSTFMMGGFTPLLKMEVEGDGKTYNFLGKLRMSREPKGGVSLDVLPMRRRTLNDKDLNLDESEMEHLRHGLILKKTSTTTTTRKQLTTHNWTERRMPSLKLRLVTWQSRR